MFELLMLLILPSEIDPPKLGMKYLLKEKFVDYRSCEKYVDKNVYLREDDILNGGLFYKIDTKEYKVFFTYCKPMEEDK